MRKMKEILQIAKIFIVELSGSLEAHSLQTIHICIEKAVLGCIRQTRLLNN